MKPLFIPLKNEYFDRFKSGEKTVEFRAYGPRWNEKTCFPGRAATLSRGYGKSERLSGIVAGFEKKRPADLSDDDARDVRAVYGPGAREIACIHIRDIRTAKTDPPPGAPDVEIIRQQVATERPRQRSGRGMLFGRKEIEDFFGKSWRTIKRWQDRYHLPLRKWVNNRPMILVDEILEWAVLVEFMMATGKTLGELESGNMQGGGVSRKKN